METPLKQLATSLLLAGMLLSITACSSSKPPSTGTPYSLTSGNWLLLEDSVLGIDGVHPKNVRLGGLLTAGSGLSAIVVPTGSTSNPCFPLQSPVPAPIVFSGTSSGNTLDLAQAQQQDGSKMTITASINPGNNFVGTYTESGIQGTTTNCQPDTGTIYGTLVPPLSGNWTGTLPAQAGTINTPSIDQTDVAASLVQVATLSEDVNAPATIGTFPLSGSVVLNNPCLPSGTVTLAVDSAKSYVKGDVLTISARSSDQTISFITVTPASLSDPTTATVINFGGNSVVVSGGACGTYTSGSIPGGNQVVLTKKS